MTTVLTSSSALSPSLPSFLSSMLFPELVRQVESSIVVRKPPPPIAKPWKVSVLWEVLPLLLDIIEPMSRGRAIDGNLPIGDIRAEYGKICRLRELICEGMGGMETLPVEDRLEMEQCFLCELWEVDRMCELEVANLLDANRSKTRRPCGMCWRGGPRRVGCDSWWVDFCQLLGVVERCLLDGELQTQLLL
ncbi:hypothetical protein BXZ70DRAFT_949358 [Cristinia sonorae]|uniref:Uncharacterized protein n=1 Tax=Cristinia sonorae TaxID=1940300 RepID=A0A8K0XMB3_9AGAR|nr:hypothetical protein BXZ70DRAFT_949358 [Cristinia sonorae]